MKKSDRALLVIVLTLAVWACFTWPLPRYLASGVPSAARNPERHEARYMVPGDHLQLMYYFWLLGDMLRGATPWFRNLYEFNTGNDAERYRPDPYYVPFSLVYALGERLGGRAFGWNLAGLVALGLTFWLTWRLTRRYVDDDWIALAAALVSIALPFRWINVLGGSPAGFGLAMVPALLLGLDKAIRDERFYGGLLAGLAVLCAYCTDLHVFFFSVLAAPFWCVVAGTRKRKFHWGQLRPYARLAWALLPFVLLTLAAFLLSRTLSGHLVQTDIAQGRGLKEVAGYSPRVAGLFGWGHLGAGSHVYLGIVTAIVIALGFVVLFASFWRGRGRHGHPALTAALLGLGILGVTTLALGTNGPFHGHVFTLCRRIIPEYDKIRQVAKVYCLMPSLLAVAAALALGAWAPLLNRRAWKVLGLLLFAVPMLGEYRWQLKPGICLLDKDQAAYAAVAQDARAAQQVPRALVLPIWPGNSHWASPYEHYVSLYRIRMVNGYSPTVTTKYIANVFRRLESANLGVLEEAQLHELGQWGVQYVLLHEDAFPEKVSPYPVVLTLSRLLAHPRLTLLNHSRNVWAFKILPFAQPARAGQPAVPCTPLFPARLWEAEAAPEQTGVKVLPDAAASGGRYVAMEALGSGIGLKPTAVTDIPDQAFLLRIKGCGILAFELVEGTASRQVGIVETVSHGWAWKAVPLNGVGSHAWLKPCLKREDGAVGVDLVMLTAGGWQPPLAGATVELPAPCFFHAGYTEPADGTVVLDPDRDPEGAVFYGLNLPLDPGEYRCEMRFGSTAPEGTLLGRLTAVAMDGQAGPADVRVGGAARLSFTNALTVPVRLNFDFTRNGDVRISQVRLSRLK
jgi:hypothetical protein